VKVWHSSSTERKPCIICGKKTGTYKVYEQRNITISIPACDNSYENRKCYDDIDIKDFARRTLQELAKRAVGQ
jgi:uncharacterized CHY-type Zn-finger protein